MLTAMGFRAHSGWAAMVAVAGTITDPHVLLRRRIEISDSRMPGAKQPYHAAAEMPLIDGETLVNKAVESSRALARDAILAAVQELHAHGHQVAGCAVLTGSGRKMPGLAGILASHALIHTAEGEMFRDVLVWAARDCGQSVECVREKEIDMAWMKEIAALGRTIGPPWTLDQKLAATAALIALDIWGEAHKRLKKSDLNDPSGLPHVV